MSQAKLAACALIVLGLVLTVVYGRSMSSGDPGALAVRFDYISFLYKLKEAR